jgi:hypothetical protein
VKSHAWERSKVDERIARRKLENRERIEQHGACSGISLSAVYRFHLIPWRPGLRMIVAANQATFRISGSAWPEATSGRGERG